jgi:glutamate-1-semialdehyde 2,1-aminomutase
MDKAGLEGLLQKADRYLTGGCLGSFRMPDEVATVFHRGEGSKIYDVTGREYIDFVLGSGPMILGHAHPKVVTAVQEQVARGSTFYGLNEPIIHLAERVVEASPCGEAIRFTSSGTEGTFSALRMARAFTGKEKILKFEGGWHGAHDYAQQSTTPPEPTDSPAPRPDSHGIPKAVGQTVLISPFNDPDTATDLISSYAGDLAAVIVEPFQRALRPEPGFLDALREAATANGVLLIFDEVVTGFRIAWGGAQERYGVIPDIAVYGKTISGGYPLAAICGRADVLACADPRLKGKGPYTFVSGTTNGNPISATAGMATIEILAEDGVYDHLYKIPGRLKEGLEAIGRELGLPLKLIGEGPVLQPFFYEGEIKTYADTLKADGNAARQLGIEMIKRDIFFNINGKLYLSLAHTEQDIDHTLEVAKEALKHVKLGVNT